MNRNLITFSANEQTLIKTGGIDNYASNTVSYIVAEFDLGENWDSFDSVRAIFQSDFETAPAVLAHGSCVVPFEVLRYRSTVRVNLVGSVAENDVLVDRLTTFPITALNVTANALVDNSIAPISPSEFEQFVAMVESDADRAEAGATSAEASAETATAAAQAAAASALSATNSASDASASAQTAQEEAQKITSMEVVVTQLPEGATPTSDWSDGVLTIGIPKGDTGDTGATGNGIESAVLNANYTLTLTFTDGTSYTTPSIRGATGATGATGNGISSVTLTSTSGAVKTYTIAFTDGTNTTFDVTDGEVTQAVLDEAVTDLKAEITQNGVVAGSNGLVSDSKISDSVPYLFRQTADGTRVGNVLYEEIVGGTVAYNQKVEHGNFDSSSGWSVYNASLSTISISDGVCTQTVTGTSATDYNYMVQRPITNNYLVVGHKYFISVEILATKTMPFRATFNGSESNLIQTVTANAWSRMSGIKTPNRTLGYFGVYPVDPSTNVVVGDVFKIRNAMVFDLTAMFGSTIADHLYQLETATAGAGVAVFRKMFPNSYYSHNAGELKSVEGLTSHDTTGFNWFDKSIAVANSRFNGSGTATASGTTRSDYIRCVANATYYFNGVHGASIMAGVFWFDANKNYVGHSAIGSSSPTVGTATAPANAFYVGINMPSANVDNVCINISSDRNGQYEPYQKRTYALDSTLTLRGIPKLDAQNNLYYDGDVYESDGTVTRKYGVINLDSITNWNVSGTNPSQHNTTIAGIKQNTDNVFSVKYLNDPANRSSASSMADGRMVVSGSAIYITSGSGVNPSGYLVYELATPTTETAEPFTSPQIVDRYGTEEYVTTGIVPIGHNSKYSEDLKGKVESLPWDFSTLIAPTETAYKATRNYTTGSLLIVNNILYKVTANIANGGTITPNTNVTATTLSEVIASL